MRHRVKKVKIGANKEHTVSMMRNLAMAVLIHERVETTSKRANAVVPFIERLISIGKSRDKMNAIRQIEKLLQHENSSRKILEELVKRYETRSSGFTRMHKIGSRKGDNAPLVQIELLP